MARTRERTRPDISGKPGYITAEGYRRLEEEAYHLWNVKRPRVTKALADAAAEGDRSENAEYIYRKKQLADIHRRCRFLGKREVNEGRRWTLFAASTSGAISYLP